MDIGYQPQSVQLYLLLPRQLSGVDDETGSQSGRARPSGGHASGWAATIRFPSDACRAGPGPSSISPDRSPAPRRMPRTASGTSHGVSGWYRRRSWSSQRRGRSQPPSSRPSPRPEAKAACGTGRRPRSASIARTRRSGALGRRHRSGMSPRRRCPPSPLGPSRNGSTWELPMLVESRPLRSTSYTSCRFRRGKVRFGRSCWSVRGRSG